MPSTSSPITDTRDNAGASESRTASPVVPRRNRRLAASVRWRAAGRAKTPLAAARTAGTSSIPALTGADRLKRAAQLIRHAFTISLVDAVSEHPDLVEDDYYRFRNRPRGC